MVHPDSDMLVESQLQDLLISSQASLPTELLMCRIGGNNFTSLSPAFPISGAHDQKTKINALQAYSIDSDSWVTEGIGGLNCTQVE